MQDVAPWVGYSSEHGWVILDRADPRNRQSFHVHFYVIPSWRELETRREDWREPAFVTSTKVIARLSEAEASRVSAEIGRAVAELPERRRVRLAERERTAERAATAGGHGRTCFTGAHGTWADSDDDWQTAFDRDQEYQDQDRASWMDGMARSDDDGWFYDD